MQLIRMHRLGALGGTNMTAGTLTAEAKGAGERPRMLDSVESARFDAVVRRSSARLVRMLDFVLLDREMAADAAQEAFVQLYLHWDEVGGSAEPEAWLYRVAVNRGKDYRRRLARATRLLARLTALTTEDNGALTGPASWHPAEDFLAALRTLPVRQRTAAALFYEADLSVLQIAEAMSISEGAVNSHLNRARSALRKILEAER
jgi:RNA polymerase sigma factor (sigma-70 family)